MIQRPSSSYEKLIENHIKATLCNMLIRSNQYYLGFMINEKVIVRKVNKNKIVGPNLT